MSRRPHEMRVIAEKADLEVRTFALEQFLDSPLFAKVDPAEQDLLKQQIAIMTTYADILEDRIAAFPPVPETSGDNPGPRGLEKSFPIETKPVEDLDGFAMMVDQWHGKCMEQGNRMLAIPEGTVIQVADVKKPGELIEMDLNGAYLQTFRVGIETVLQIFKDLPFGVSLEDAPDDAAPEEGTPSA